MPGVPARLQLDNGNFEARVTLEPEPDNAAAPFFLVLLRDAVIGPAVARDTTLLTMENRVRASFPSATIKINR